MNTETNIQIINFFSDEYKNELKIRNEVLRLPLNMSIYNDNLDKEHNDIHIAAYRNNEMIGILLLTELNTDTVKMIQVAVLTDFQGLNIGTHLVQFAEKFAKNKGYLSIELNARKTALEFYQKCGYEIIGEEFLEINLPHFKMKKKLF